MSYRIPLGVVAFLYLVPLPAAAQEGSADHGPPKVLQIFVESVKVGKGTAHEKIETGWPQAFRKAKWPTHYIGTTTATGVPEAWFLSGYESFAAMETDQQNVGKNPTLSRELERLSALDGDMLTNTRGILATYNPELSYRAAVDIGRMRYFSLNLVTLKPGYDSAFADARKLIRDAHEKANLDEHFAVYDVVSGIPGPAYLVIIPMRSLQEVDAFMAGHDSKPYRDAIGESGRQQLREFARAGIVSGENRLLAFSAKMSYPSDDWIASDPEFWKPKVVTAAKP
jgi:hypothetical protein